MNKRLFQKWMSLLLCLVLLAGNLPALALAAGEEGTAAAGSMDAQTTGADSSEEPAEEPVEEPVEEPAEEPVEEPAEEPVEEPSGDPDTAPTSGMIEGGNLHWVLTADGTLTIFGEGGMKNFNWTPNAPNADYDQPWVPHILSIKRIVVEEGVTRIGNNAFNGCSRVTSVSLPDSLEKLGYSCFENCINLTQIVIPEGITELPGSSFSGCSALTSVTIPQSVATIGSNVFSSCEALSTIALPENLTRLESGVFSGCTALSSLELPQNLTYIGNSVFQSCAALTKIKLPAGLTFLGEGAFQWSGITEITLPAGITELSVNVFNGCESLTSITIPAGVRAIWASAFNWCTGLSSITFEGPAPGIHDSAFTKVTATVYYPENYASWEDVAGKNYGGTLTWQTYTKEDGDDQLILASGTLNSGHSWVLAEDGTLTVSGQGVMEDFQWTPNAPNAEYSYPWAGHLLSIRKIVVEEGVTGIGNNAFNGCSRVTSVSLPDSLEKLGYSCFEDCINLTQIVIPEGITELPGHCFSGCSALTSVTIPQSVTTIGSNVFSYCKALSTVALPENLTKLESGVFSNCTALNSLELPQNLTYIGNSVFQSCAALTKIELPAGLTFLGEGAFQWSGITEITLPAGITELSVNVFNCCESLTSITIPAGVRAIWASAFNWCTKLSSITFEGSAPGIHDSAFTKVTATVYYPENYATWDNVAEKNYGGTLTWQTYDSGSTEAPVLPGDVLASGTLSSGHGWVLTADGTLTVSGQGVMEDFQWTPNAPNAEYSYPWAGHLLSIRKIVVEEGVTGIGNNAFNGCSRVTSVSLPDSLEKLDYSCFEDCINLTQIVIPEGITELPGSCFSGCSALTSVTIPQSVTTIGSNVFSSCEALSTIALPENLTRLESGVFSGCTALSSLELPQNLTYIGNSVFQSCAALTKIKLPAGLTFLGEGAFQWSGITEITLPAGITELSVNVFNGCESLTSIIIPAGVKSVWNSAFYWCKELSTVTFAGSAPGIHDSAFTNVTATVYYPQNYPSWDGMQLNYGGNLTWVPFDNGLTEDYDPNTVIASGICGDSMGWALFADGTIRLTGLGRMHTYDSSEEAPWAPYSDQISALEVEEGVQSISANAFAGQENLQSAELPASLEEVGSAAFSDCSALSSITFSGSAPSVAEDAFENVQATVFIPENSWTQEEMDSLGENLTWEQTLASGSCGNNASWSFDSETKVLTITGTGAMADYSADTNAPWSGYSSDVTKLVIGEGITSVGSFAFLGMSSLEEVCFPLGLTSISDQAFAGCSSLKALMLPDDLTHLGEEVFEGCSAVEELYIPAGITDVSCFHYLENIARISLAQDHSAFALVDGVLFSSDRKTLLLYPRQAEVEYYQLPDGVEAIASHAFHGADNLRGVFLPVFGTVKTIGSGAFMNCSGLIEIHLPTGITTIGPAAFMNCSNLERVLFSFDSDLTEIGASAFRGCGKLSDISLPMSLRSIGSNAFENCGSLNHILFPVNVADIGIRAFAGSGLSGMEFFCDAPKIAEDAFTGVTATVYYPTDRAGWASVVGSNFGGNLNNWIPFQTVIFGSWGDNITWIYDQSYKHLILSGSGAIDHDPEQDYPWAQYAFETSILTVKEGITAIGRNCFREFAVCQVLLPDSLERIDSYAFYGCGNLYGITLPRNLNRIAEYAFALSALNSVSIPDSVTTLLACAFSDCGELTSVKLGSGLTDFGSYIFQNCGQLTQIEFPDHFSRIPKGMFFGCERLMLVYLPASLTRIEYQAFGFCHALSCIAFLGSAPVIDAGAFEGVNHGGAWYPGYDASWTKDNRQNYGGKLTWHSYTESSVIGGEGSCGDNLTWSFDPSSGVLTVSGKGSMDDFYNDKVGDFTYSPWRHWNNRIRHVVIEEGVTSVSAWCFPWLSQLKTLTLPDSVNRIERFAFCGTGLTELTIPSDYVYIQYAAFGRTPLEKITFAGRGSIDAEAFWDVTADVYYPSYYWRDEQIQDYGGQLTWIPYGDPALKLSLGGDKIVPLNSLVSLYLEVYPYDAYLDLSVSFSDPSAASFGGVDGRHVKLALHQDTPVTVTVTDQNSGLSTSCLLIPLKEQTISAPFEMSLAVDSSVFGRRFIFTPEESGLYICLSNDVTQPGYEAAQCYVTTSDMDWLEPESVSWAEGFCRSSFYLEKGVTYFIENYHNHLQIGSTYRFRFFKADAQPETVTIYPEKILADVGMSLDLKAFVGPQDTDGAIVWSSSNPDIADVYFADSYGCAFQALTPGTAVITASCGTVSDSVTVEVLAPPVLEIGVPLELENHSFAFTGFRNVSFTAPADGLYAVTVTGADGCNFSNNPGDVLYSQTEDSTTIVRYFTAGESDILGVTFLGWDGNCTVTAQAVEPTDGMLSLHILSSYDSYLDISSAFTPVSGAEPILHWESSDETILSLSHNHNHFAHFTVIRKGTVTVTATSASGKTASIVLQVGQCLDGHDFGPWEHFNDALGCSTGQQIRHCSRCDSTQIIPVAPDTGSLTLSSQELGSAEYVWIDGRQVSVLHQGDTAIIDAPLGSTTMVTFDMHIGDPEDLHTQYPTHMQVWLLSWEDDVCTARRVEELDDILQYSGSSIRISGNKGIRMITSVDMDKKSSLIGSGLAGLTLVEYGTILSWKSDLEGDNPLILGQSYSRSNYAYKRGVADPVFAYAGNLMQYTNVLVGFTLQQCADDIAMRSYMIVEDDAGNQYTIYGGIVYRSIGYIAWQNRNVFAPGTAAYEYVWEIIHAVYGDVYDQDYVS